MGCAPHLSVAVVRKAVSQRGRAFSTWGCHRLWLEFKDPLPAPSLSLSRNRVDGSISLLGLFSGAKEIM